MKAAAETEYKNRVNNATLQEADATKEEMREYALQQIPSNHARATQHYARTAEMESAGLTRTHKIASKTATQNAAISCAKQAKETPAQKTAKRTAETEHARQDSTSAKMATATVLVNKQNVMKPQTPAQKIAEATIINVLETRSANMTEQYSILEMKEDSSTAKKTAVQHHAKQMTIALQTTTSHA